MPDKPHPGRHHRFNITVEDPNLEIEVVREYVLHLPAHYDTSNTVPVPLVLDYHGWGGTARDQMVHMPWRDVADMDHTGFIYITLQGMSDVPEGGFWGSWNVTRSDGPPICDPTLHSGYANYASCGEYDVEGTCDWTSCHDDLAFTEVVLYHVTSSLCVDLDQIHMSGASNGGMFIYTRALPAMAASLASVAPVCSSPMRGFNYLPSSPVNIISMHGLHDRTIPYSVAGPGNLGPGPDGTVTAKDGWYYHIETEHLLAIREWMGCSPDPLPYPTHMDGVHGWVCSRWGGCRGGKEVVHCHGEYDHDYPFNNRYIEGVIILWDFMKTHTLN